MTPAPDHARSRRAATRSRGCAGALVLALALCAALGCGVKGKPRPPSTHAQLRAASAQIRAVAHAAPGTVTGNDGAQKTD